MPGRVGYVGSVCLLTATPPHHTLFEVVASVVGMGDLSFYGYWVVELLDVCCWLQAS
jgi:hypothetical protein